MRRKVGGYTREQLSELEVDVTWVDKLQRAVNMRMRLAGFNELLAGFEAAVRKDERLYGRHPERLKRKRRRKV